MKLTLKYDDEGAYFDINELSSWYDVSKIAFYTIDEKDGNIEVKVYDENQELIAPKDIDV